MGIGSAGTTAVDPSNPLYDDVKAGGGFVKDEETGEVTGGPDGDGTARTEQERKAKANNPMGDPDLIENDDPESSAPTDEADKIRKLANKISDDIPGTSRGLATTTTAPANNDTSGDPINTDPDQMPEAQTSDDTTLLLGAAAATAVGALVVWRVL